MTLKVAIIGAGPSGLVTARFLLHAHTFFPGVPPIDVTIFEQSDRVGGAFQLRVYEGAELVSSKYLTAFSDFRLPPDAPDFLSPERYCKYLEDYADAFGITPHIRFHTSVLSMSRTSDGKHAVSTAPASSAGTSSSPTAATTQTFDSVAICVGMHTYPAMPLFPGVDKVPVVLHSSQIKTKAQLGKDTNVLVLGAGETGLDMAYMAVTSGAKRVMLSHRNGFFCGPKIVPRPIILGGLLSKEPTTPNKPVDCSVASLFDTAYVPPLLQHSPLQWWYYDRMIKISHTLISGAPNGPDQWAGLMDAERRHVNSVFFVKTPHALSYISAGHRSTSLLNRLRASIINVPIKDTGGRRIETAPWPRELTKDGLVFEKPADASLAGFVPDVVVFATGYRREIAWLDEAEYGSPMTVDVRGVYSSRDISVAFIGFKRPSLGAIPPLAEMQAQLWVYRLLQHKYPAVVPTRFPHAIAPYELSYSLHSRAGTDLATLKGGVDHECYAYQLAVDIGAAPEFSHVWRLSRSWKLMYTWAMGSNFNTKFRLVGPWKMESEAVDVMEGELYGVTRPTGGLGYFVLYTVMPFVFFGVLSLSILAVEAVVNGVCSVFSGRRRRGYSAVNQ